MKIVIAPCHLSYIDKRTHWCIASLFRSKKHLYNHVLSSPTATADISRSLIASGFLNTDYDALFFVDDDIVFNPEDVDKLADHIEKDNLNIVGGCYVVKGGNYNPSSRFFDGQTIEFNVTAKPVEIMYLAGGFMMIHRRVLEKMVSSIPLCAAGSKIESEFYPFFAPIIKRVKSRLSGLKITHEYLTEDFSFCERAKMLGYKIYLDPSIRLEHIGKKRYRLEDIFNGKQENMVNIKLTKQAI